MKYRVRLAQKDYQYVSYCASPLIEAKAGGCCVCVCEKELIHSKGQCQEIFDFGFFHKSSYYLQ
jgi:hypothetical protein